MAPISLNYLSVFLALAVISQALAAAVTSPADINAYLSGHNTFRAKHGAAALTWSDKLAAAAQKWASGCVFKHSGGSVGPYGENLAAGTGSFSIANGISLWTNEAKDYNPSNPVPSHFTQVVWKATTQLGCALVTCPAGSIFDASYISKPQFRSQDLYKP